ncbi:Bax1-I family protein YbhL [Candidatus Magnetomoraceae bacterium gMMP-15]
MQALSLVQERVRVNEFIRSVYNWMGIGLALTGVIALFVASSPTLANIFLGTPLFWILIIGELGLVFYLSARVEKIQASTATGLFLFYAGLNGVTLSAVFLVYSLPTIATTFFVCAATFGACSVYGMVTKRDLTSVGDFCMMGLIGIIIASVVNIFMRSPAVAMITSYIGVIIFVGLTAYDTQKLKTMALTQPDGLDAAVIRKGAIIGALTLYLDFINMFLMLLHIFGGGED